MFESKYSKYLTENKTRFAEEEEITHSLSTVNQGCGVPLYAKGKTIYVDNMDNHSMTIGGTGCGKSRAVSKVLIKSVIKKKKKAELSMTRRESCTRPLQKLQKKHTISKC